MIKTINLCVLSALATGFSSSVLADHNETLQLEEVSVTAPIDSRIVNHPAVVESFSKQQIEDTINATTSQQTLKY